MSELRRWTAQLRHVGRSIADTLRRSRRAVVAASASSPRGAESGLVPARLGDRDGRRRDAPLVVACAWCGRYRVGSSWLTAVDASMLVDASHGICPGCLAKLDCVADETRV